MNFIKVGVYDKVRTWLKDTFLEEWRKRYQEMESVIRECTSTVLENTFSFGWYRWKE